MKSENEKILTLTLIFLVRLSENEKENKFCTKESDLRIFMRARVKKNYKRTS